MAKGKLILDRYRLLGEAGAGGYGTVMVAWDPRIQRKVAIKTILLTETDALRAALPGADAVAGQAGAPGATDTRKRWHGVLPWDEVLAEDDAAASDREDAVAGTTDEVPALVHIPGLDEARTAAMLSDPHIVTVYDVEVRDQTAYLIMEYIEGITLTKLLRDYSDLITLDVVACVVDSVAAALKKAHGRHVLHLDIKPDNILINREGQVKVTDFGLATLVDASGAGTTGGGTIGYMPLEQIQRRGLDARTDEWSLASVTYEMLTGMNPFIAPDLEQAEAVLEDVELVLPSLCWDGLDEGMDDVLFYALEPDKEERYETIGDFQVEADKFLGDAKTGERQLKRIVAEAIGDALANSEDLDDADDADYLDGEGDLYDDEIPARYEGRRRDRSARDARVPMSARFTPRVKAVLARTIGALSNGFIAFLALANMPFFTGWLAGLSNASDITPSAVMGVLIVAVAILGAAWPHVGALVAFCALALAFIMGSSPILGVILLAATIAWWYFAGRHGIASANVASALPLAGAIGFNAIVPLAAGQSLKPSRSFITVGFAAVWALALGACGTGNLLGWNGPLYWNFSHVDAQSRVLVMLVSPTTWCIVASWLAAAALAAACNLKGSKPLAIVGIVLAGAVLVAGALGAAWYDSGMRSLEPSVGLIAPIVVSTIVTLAAVVWIRPRI